MNRRDGDAVLLGEVSLAPEDQRTFFGDEDGDELHMRFSFTVNQAMYLALAREQSAPLEQALAALPAIPPDSQWASFVRNHDELTLDKLSGERTRGGIRRLRAEEELQLFGRGLRRRLPTMLGGDQQRIRMVYSLMFSLPGTPVLFPGEEIGMGENLAIEGRMSVRAPMQWSAAPNGGFSAVEDPEALPPGDRGGVRPRARQRVRATARPRLAAQLDGAADPATARVPRAQVGPLHRAVTARDRGVRPTAATGTTRRSWPCTTSPATTSRRGCRSRATARSSTCSAARTSSRRSRSSSTLRLPLVPPRR